MKDQNLKSEIAGFRDESLATKKITMATFKKFLKNEGLYISAKSSFDGMTDCVESLGGEFKEAKRYRESEREAVFINNGQFDNRCGFDGIWAVGQSRDYFRYYNDGIFEGIEISNSCGCSIAAIKLID